MSISDLGKNLSDYLAQAQENVTKTSKLSRKPDIYLTYGGGMSLCCIASEYNISHGINSSIEKQKCPKHRAEFIDNEYTKPYNHQKHLEVVHRQAPKYATVRDIIPESICKETGIVYYEAEQILEWAEELKQYAENVIVIPKHQDYLKVIPNHFIIGFPVPSGYGLQGEERLPIAPEEYRGRKLHLLGGSWARQLSYLYLFGDNVVSIDNNYIVKLAMLRQFVDPAGKTHTLDLPFELKRALHVSFSISCSSIETALDKIIQ